MDVLACIGQNAHLRVVKCVLRRRPAGQGGHCSIVLVSVEFVPTDSLTCILCVHVQSELHILRRMFWCACLLGMQLFEGNDNYQL